MAAFLLRRPLDLLIGDIREDPGEAFDPCRWRAPIGSALLIVFQIFQTGIWKWYPQSPFSIAPWPPAPALSKLRSLHPIGLLKL
jgi:hypothetical protein